MGEGRCILLVEDELPIRSGLRDHLQRAGFAVVEADTLASARRALVSPPDLVVLDRRLPDGDGLTLLHELRAAGSVLPVIVLSALGQVNDRVGGLEGGADDYVTKPFHLVELVARVRAVLARSRGPGPQATRLHFGVHELDVAARRLFCGKREVPLTRREFDVLLYLLRNQGRVVTRHELLNDVWGEDSFPTTRTIDFHVLSLRRKIEGRSRKPHLMTVHRVGYRFEP